MDYKYTAIILSKTDVGETDRIYSFYAREAGKMRALGKGVRKPASKLAGSLEPLTMAEIFLAKTRGLGKITGAITVYNFSKLKSDWEAVRKVFEILKIFFRLVSDQQNDEKIFDLLQQYLLAMEKSAGHPEKLDLLSLGFSFKLLDKLGYRLEAEKCVNCAGKLKPDGNFFSPARGGILCAVCQQAEIKKVKISAEAIKLVRIFLKNKIENLSKLQAPQKDINNLKTVVQEALNWI